MRSEVIVNYRLLMKDRMKRLLSLAFILLFLMKGLSSLSPLFSSALEDAILTELQAETEQENHKANSRIAETEPVEDFFEKAHFSHDNILSLLNAPARIVHSQHSLQWVHLDIQTPPPDFFPLN